ncbi:alpha-amylase family glycosyl hydrolase [Thalassotalea euphylliae]|uniref:Alpha-amylase n=1 Tax=Thalassotalea euphylliae TaxID=1655234 RepID=A0A3E0UIP7_9GAMM|nr:alpha-amylase family glycosyl hydrolase [Thalassotalea euphylliae]REL36497.1 alpha-amylase [Thalassotalea euphylliae]
MMKLNKPLVLSSLALSVTLALSACNDSTNSNESDNNTAIVEQENSSTLAHYLNRDIQDDVFYFVMPDRFYNGDTTNDLGSESIAISRGGFDKTSKSYYHGGDIKGLTDKIPYLKEMGITAIWLTPILRNQAVQGDVSGYHGYWVLDFTEIDPHLGTNADLKRFIDTAHDENIKVFFDIITNHTADVIRYKECHGEGEVAFSDGEQQCEYKSLAQVAAGDKYTPFVPDGMENLKVPSWLNDTKYYHNQGDSTFQGENSIYGDFFGLDDINTDDPEVVAGLTEVFKDIITEFKPDGFRIDTVKHVNIEFWQAFSPALVEHAKSLGLPKFFMFGEVFDGNPDVLSRFTTEGKVPSVLDFGFAFAVRNVLVDQKGTSELANLFAQDVKYRDHDSDENQLLNFVGNHDFGRFAWYLQQSEHNYLEAEKLARLTLAHQMMYFLRGIPVTYYGSEQGFVGDGGNHDSRQDMMPSQVASYNDDDLLGTDKTTADDNFDQVHPLYLALKQMAEIYQAHPVLRYGQQQVIYSNDKAEIFAVTRTLPSGEQYLLAFNTANEHSSANLLLGNQVGEKIYQSKNTEFSVQGNQTTLNMAPLSVAIFNIHN